MNDRQMQVAAFWLKRSCRLRPILLRPTWDTSQRGQVALLYQKHCGIWKVQALSSQPASRPVGPCQLGAKPAKAALLSTHHPKRGRWDDRPGISCRSTRSSS